MSKLVQLRSEDKSLPILLLKTRNESMKIFRQVLSTYDLSDQQWRILRVLKQEKNGLAMRDISKKVFSHSPSVTRSIKGLEEMGFISRRFNANDRRSFEIQLTAKGMKLVDRVAGEVEPLYLEIEKYFNSDIIKRCLNDLVEIHRGLEEINKKILVRGLLGDLHPKTKKR